jgi:prevent-host-death family protein
MTTIALAPRRTVTASDLQRKTKQVLDDASKGPVSLSRRNAPDITLVSSDLWNEATHARAWLSFVTSIVHYVVERAEKGEGAAYPAEFSWLRSFEVPDLRDFLTELTAAVTGALHGGRSWELAEAVIEEWRRSAAVLEDAELSERLKHTLQDLNLKA